MGVEDLGTASSISFISPTKLHTILDDRLDVQESAVQTVSLPNENTTEELDFIDTGPTALVNMIFSRFVFSS